jgi:biotin carboxyl carrier protein
MKYEVTVGENVYIIEVNREGEITFDGEVQAIDFAPIGDSGLYSLLVNNGSFEALVEQRDERWQVLMQGYLYEVEVLDERSQLMRARSTSLVPDSGELLIKAPMPGLVVDVSVEVGQEVEAGQKVVILESMKMENELKTPRAGEVERIQVKAGDSVEQNEVLVVIV